MRRAAKVDANQREIVTALERLGWVWLDLTRVGGGCPDGVAIRGDVARLVEIKGKKGKLTPEQVALHARMPVRILRSVEDAEALH